MTPMEIAPRQPVIAEPGTSAPGQVSSVLATSADTRPERDVGRVTFTVRAPDATTWDRLQRGGTYAVARAFVDGTIEVRGSMVAALRWWQRTHPDRHANWSLALAMRLHLESWVQSRRRASDNISFHYDRSNRFYEQFLDARMQYSSAYYTSEEMSLDDAQEAKLDYLCRRLNLRPGQRFLDVGCGWGGLVAHAAERYGVQATGCTLSAEQFAWARQAVVTRGLDGQVAVEKCDYRDLDGQYDQIASIGMYEHVGIHRLRPYFAALAARLAPGGLILNQGIARPQTARDDLETVFLRRYVFPGGELPNLSTVIAAAEDSGLEVIEVVNLRAHYARTCAAWVARLEANREACVAFVGERTYRIWRLYLAASAVNFEQGQIELYQLLLGRRADAPQRTT